ncbi:MAG: hypothetical protein HUJ76_02195 [Parasporobacterium sp.]|nr:hypothetical protein [Parasporobacterium sp.]
MKGKGLLKVCGILMIIFAGISLIVTVPAIIGVVALSASVSAGLGAIVLIGLIIGIAGSIIELIVGIVGVANCAKPEKAKTCLAWGIVICAITVISLIISLVGGGLSGLSIILSIISGLALPVLFIVGAVKNMNS